MTKTIGTIVRTAIQKIIPRPMVKIPGFAANRLFGRKRFCGYQVASPFGKITLKNISGKEAANIYREIKYFL